MKDNIVLIGFMGSGKSSIGIKLAHALDYKFLDTDAYIEARERKKISEIFATYKEEGFREMESQCLRDLRDSLSGYVVATGGGMPLRPENAKLLKEIGTVFYLKASKEVTYERLKEDKSRPLLQGGDPVAKIDALLKERIPIYEAAANFTITTDNRSFYSIIQEILSKR